VEEILAWFDRRGVTLVELTVAANNSEAIPFWKRLGFFVYMHQMKKELREQATRNGER
jgi:ribosomal protein S18 acetylase RimI-like enzyme